MTVTAEPLTAEETFADLYARIGCVPLNRIALHPYPGGAHEEDVLVRRNGVKHLYELVEGVLIEKAMGYRESELAGVLIQIILNYLDAHHLGIALGEAATLRLMPGLVRIPDVCFISWARFPGGRRPEEPMPNLIPDLAVEIISAGNTKEEMELKLREYFRVGV
ncbi:MAG TPA: Uma2 family endonuclease, partial [Chthonomonadales bacterium]|nr:Uma2 family endonuclease [Chthonomonadales bacterium]